MVSQAVGYAATALGRIAAAGGTPVLIKEIAEDCAIPAAYLAKIINVLARKGLLNTQRGVGGGVTLGKAATEVVLLDLCQALDDPIVQSRCMLGTAECSDERACPAHHFWTTHRARQIDFLRNTSVADVAAFESRRRWKHLRGEGLDAAPEIAPIRVTLGGVAPERISDRQGA